MKLGRDLISSRGVSFQNRQGYAMSRIINFSLRAFVASWLILGQLLSLATVSLAGQAPAQSQVVSLGVLDFQNETRLNIRPDLLQKIAQELNQNFVAAYKDVLPRPISAGGDSSIKTMTIEQLTALGKQYGVRFVVRGGLLGLTREGDGEGAIFRAKLYADIISVESASIKTLRVEGVGSQDGAPAPAGLKGGAFGTSAMEQALSSAIEQLASAINQAITEAPAAGEQVADSISADQDNAQADSIGAQDAAETEADEELQQLIAQADELISNGAASAGILESLSQALEKLRAALTLKATLLEEGKDTAEADREIAAEKEELQAAISAIIEEISSAETSALEDQPLRGNKKNVLARVNEYLGEALSIIQKIQEIRAALRNADQDSALDETAFTEEGSEQALPAEEETEEISGAVTESGAPVEGAIVTEIESGMSATTDSSGSYTLKGIPGGRLVDLVIQKGGKKVAAGRVYLPRRRAAVADFDLRYKPSKAAPPSLKVMPSTVLVSAARKANGGTGMLKGTVQDAEGRPIARALVTLKGLAVARTDSRGQYAIMNVPAGAHQLTIYKSGLKLNSEKVVVTVNNTSKSESRLASGDKIPKLSNKQPLRVKGTGAVLHGAVFDKSKRAIPGAKVTLIYSVSATSLLTGPNGKYRFRGLKPQPYRIMVSKAGYETSTQTIIAREGQIQVRDFLLEKNPAALINKLLVSKQADSGNNQSGSHQPDAKLAQLPMKRSQLMGRVIDAKTRRPLPEASVSISGRPVVKTDRDGVYRVGNIKPGTYHIVISKTGFSDHRATITIRSGEGVKASFQLSPKSLLPSSQKPPGIR